MEPRIDILTRLCELLEREGAAFRVVEHVAEGHTEAARVMDQTFDDC